LSLSLLSSHTIRVTNTTTDLPICGRWSIANPPLNCTPLVHCTGATRVASPPPPIGLSSLLLPPSSQTRSGQTHLLMLATLGEVTLDEWIRTLVRCENWIATSSLVYIVWMGVLSKIFQMIFIMTILIVLLQLILEFYLHVCSFWGTLIFVEFNGEYSLHFHLFHVPLSFTINITALCVHHSNYPNVGGPIRRPASIYICGAGRVFHSANFVRGGSVRPATCGLNAGRT